MSSYSTPRQRRGALPHSWCRWSWPIRQPLQQGGGTTQRCGNGKDDKEVEAPHDQKPEHHERRQHDGRSSSAEIVQFIENPSQCRQINRLNGPRDSNIIGEIRPSPCAEGEDHREHEHEEPPSPEPRGQRMNRARESVMFHARISPNLYPQGCLDERHPTPQRRCDQRALGTQREHRRQRWCS